MTTPEEMRAATVALTERAKAALAAFAATLDYSDPEAARDALLAFLPALVAEYGEMSAAIAADWYEEQREDAGISSPFAVILAAAVPTYILIRAVRFAAVHLWTDNPGMTVTYLAGIVQKYALKPGRDTITLNSDRDKESPGWSRKTRPGACQFCRDLAGNGAVYESKERAAFLAHTNCHCIAVPAFGKNNRGKATAAMYKASESKLPD